MITIAVTQYDRETEVGITAAKSGLDVEDAARIVDVVRSFRSHGLGQTVPTVRACIMIGRITAMRNASVAADDRIFRETCRDVLRVEAIKITRDGDRAGDAWLDDLLSKHCPVRPRRNLAHVGLAETVRVGVN
jgi:nitric oxide reductase NorQ protein